MTQAPLPLAGASALILNTAGEYLLHLRDDVPGITNPGTWSLLGGHLDDGESTDEAVVRELAEEAGLVLPSLRPYTVVENRGIDRPATARVQVYLGSWDGDPEELPLTEGIMLRFFDGATTARLRMAPWAREIVAGHLRKTGCGARPRQRSEGGRV
ncbi:NUDIX domain-containing protein [Streptomyces sp. NPDC090303]|uniref:NUDIX domain-containing protein n=1 Tax=Streptomyces sp. NPDC090303 TaxID=3365960 RepID=UPI0037FEEC59